MKNYIRVLCVLAVLSFTAFLFAGGQEEVSTGGAGAGPGTMVYLEGDVFINDSPAEIGDPVMNSDIIRTGEASYCEVIFGDRNVFRLEENTVADIDWSGSRVDVQEGALGAVFNKLDNFISEMNDQFEINTPSAVAGIRGTVFYIKVEDPDNTYICICNGELDLGKTSPDLKISSQHHKAYRFTKRDGSISYSDAPMLYHDDPKMDDIASQIGYTVPWGETSGKGY